MSPTLQPRVLSGIPTAGQWTSRAFREPSLSLSARFDDELLERMANNPLDNLPEIPMTPAILHAVRARLDATGDPSSSIARKAAEEAYESENAYTAAEYQRYVRAHGDTSAWDGGRGAVRRDIEQMRKEDSFLATALD